MRFPKRLIAKLDILFNRCHCVYCKGTRDDLVEYAADLEMKIFNLKEEIEKLKQSESA